MKLFAIGFGQAGGKIVDLLLEYDMRTRQNSIARALAINTAKADLMGLRYIPMDDRLLIGQTIAKGHGIGADNELGAKIATDDIYTIQSAVDIRGTHETDAFLIVAGLGGGTGSGGAPVIARRLKKLYTEPVYGLGILPSNDEGSLYSLNAARSLMTFIKEVDSLFLFDNDSWKKEGTTLVESYQYINEEIARRFGIILGAGESPVSTVGVGESVIDSSEIINTLKGGDLAVIGYAREEAKRMGFWSKLRNMLRRRTSIETLDATTRVVSLVRRAAMGRLTIPSDIKSAEKALILVAGPPDQLSRVGTEKARLWLEEAIGGGEVRGGDYPVPDSKYVASVVLLSGVSDIPRIKELQKLAVEAQERMKEFTEKKGERLEELMRAEDLRPLF
ncbi:MAG: tubulin/FtsZ family protein [Methanocellales archaeon]|nr:tubulin/FtsZ family protein [Methanocellales archaeon]MDI6902416.1 tubulin/FtsZ family protein [Methanocellales archaeon]